jgi:hypothetical protein
VDENSRSGVGAREPSVLPVAAIDGSRCGTTEKLRDTLLTSLTGMPPDVQTVGAATFTLGETGEMSWSPGGAGWRWVYGAMLGEVLLSQQTGKWQRLKQCRHQVCRAVFYDSSWNSGTIWHNARTCGMTVQQPNSVELASSRSAAQEH